MMSPQGTVREVVAAASARMVWEAVLMTAPEGMAWEAVVVTALEGMVREAVVVAALASAPAMLSEAVW